MECIETKIVKARKEHTCDYCIEAIVPGTKYNNFTGKHEGEVYHFKSHLVCQFVADQLSSKFKPHDDGMDTNAFYEAVEEFYDEFINPRNLKDTTLFAEKIIIVANKLKEYEFVEELKKPTKPYSRFWNPIKRYLKKREAPLTID